MSQEQSKALQLAEQCQDIGESDGWPQLLEAAAELRRLDARAALAPQGEPVARVELITAGGNAGIATRIVEIDDPLRERLRPGDVLYTRPAAAAQAVPMTDEEIDYLKQGPSQSHRDFARAIEAHHGIPGNGGAL